MPIFEYLCDDCGEKCEKIQSQPLEQITCPSCGKKAGRIVSVFSAAEPGTGGGCTPTGGSGFG